MTLTFTGFYDRSPKKDVVTAEAVILKICDKKVPKLPVTQLSAQFICHVPVGSCEVPHNPDGTAHADGALTTGTTVITVPGNSFCPSGNGLVGSYVLLLRVTARGQTRYRIQINNNERGEPPFKKALRDACRRGPVTRSGSGTGGNDSAESRHYVGEMVVYDQQRCLLTEGEYQLVLRPWGPKAELPAQTASWESLNHTKGVPPMEAFDKCPRVVFQLAWGKAKSSNGDTAVRARTARPVLSPLEQNVAEPRHKRTRSRRNTEIKAGQQPQQVQLQQQQEGNSQAVHDSSGTVGSQQQQQSPLSHRTRVAYQFVFQRQMLQHTKARADLRCPWCRLQCCLLPALLKHLKLCHGRFTFSLVPHPKGARIDVSINESYDESYAGNQQHLHTQMGYAFDQTDPARRTPVTDVIVCRPKRTPLSILEFIEQDEPDYGQPCIPGHRKVYYHTGTGMPIRPQHIDHDSESESYPEWRRIKTQLMIDDFTDVNEGEKELMKMWNFHLMKHRIVGNCHVPRACNIFVEEQGQELIQRNLYRNFVLHMCNLFDFGLVSATDVYETVRKLQTFCEAQDPH
ncbi:hypothetical protein V5799_005131 [Amblyomma americanum]|uniref:Polycomb protein suz12 n=1 Tax=Amblyomma americanum TaxID=6943 RepID=A0AAQ4E048_AMBAM